jgi:hypothetical protein
MAMICWERPFTLEVSQLPFTASATEPLPMASSRSPAGSGPSASAAMSSSLSEPGAQLAASAGTDATARARSRREARWARRTTFEGMGALPGAGGSEGRARSIEQASCQVVISVECGIPLGLTGGSDKIHEDRRLLGADVRICAIMRSR